MIKIYISWAISELSWKEKNAFDLSRHCREIQGFNHQLQKHRHNDFFPTSYWSLRNYLLCLIKLVFLVKECCSKFVWGPTFISVYRPHVVWQKVWILLVFKALVWLLHLFCNLFLINIILDQLLFVLIHFLVLFYNSLLTMECKLNKLNNIK